MEQVAEIMIFYNDDSEMLIKALNNAGYELHILRVETDGCIHGVYKKSK